MPLAFVWTREPNFQSKAILLYLSSLRFCARVSQINTSIFFELLRRLNVDYLSSSTSLKIVFMTDWCDWHARQKNVFSCALNLRKEFLDGQMWLKIIVFFISTTSTFSLSFWSSRDIINRIMPCNILLCSSLMPLFIS